jgi:hypothetical protein
MEHPKKDLIRMLVRTSDVRDNGDGDNGDGSTLFGDFAVFNKWTEIDSMWEGTFLERIAPGAFDKTIRERRDQFKVLLNHGMDPELGNKPLGSITDLKTTDRAASYEVGLFNGIPELVMDGLRAGEYGASFRFEVLDEHWDEKKDDLPRRTIKEVKLFEFGPVTFPAYEAASAGVRSHGDMMIWQKLNEADRKEFVRLLFKATSNAEADTVTSTHEAGEETSSEPEASTPFAKYRKRIEEWEEQGYEHRAY